MLLTSGKLFIFNCTTIPLALDSREMEFSAFDCEYNIAEQKVNKMICFKKLIFKPDGRIIKIMKKVRLSSYLYYNKFVYLFHLGQSTNNWIMVLSNFVFNLEKINK